MKHEFDPVTDDEWLLRRVHRQYFRNDPNLLISPSAFEPRVKGREPDVDGISLFRLACVPSHEAILAHIAEDKRKDYGVVRVSVRLVVDLGLTVVAKPIPQLPGHIVIAELNANAYRANKSQFIVMKLRLAEEASRPENILVYPKSLGP
jgi:hypothetical protein